MLLNRGYAVTAFGLSKGADQSVRDAFVGHDMHLMFNTYAVLTLVLIVIHQSIIASSAFFLTETIHLLGQGQPFIGYLLLYFVAMIVPFIPGCLSYVTMQSWANRAHESLMDSFVQRCADAPFLIQDEKASSAARSLISRNSFSAILEYVSQIHNLASFGLNSVLSFIVISLLLPSDLWLGYVLSSVGCVAVVGFLLPRVNKLSQRSQSYFSAYGSVLGKMIPTLPIGNEYNTAVWACNNLKAKSIYYRSLIKLAWLKQAGNFLLGMVTLVPTAYLIFQNLKSSEIEAGLVAATIVNLTRVFHILNSLSALVYQVIEFGDARAAYAFVVKGAVPNREERSLDFKRGGGITVNHEEVQDLDEYIEMLEHKTAGRLTVRGPNGSGKTSFMLQVKARYGSESFYLPSAVETLVWPDAPEGKSTGERMMQVLAQVQALDNIRLLLLDEWDANLDLQNTRAMDAMIAELSASKVVVEVRH